MNRLLVVLLFAALSVGCGTRPIADFDGGTGQPDAGNNELDAGVADAGQLDAGPLDSGTADAGFDAGADAGLDAGIDLDRDGLDDAFEASLAAAYLPVLAVHPQDACPLGGILYRARKHPLDPSLVFIVYDHLLQRDCGVTSHFGDDEVFSVTLNPALPPPRGITAMRAISHQGTICQRVSTCGTCSGLSACEVNGAGRPLVYFSKDKHGSYVSLSACMLSCLDQCVAADRPNVPLINAGEPNAHLTEDLTDAGFITAANGWTEASLLHFNPWGGTNFGGAGNVSSDLVDPAFDLPACR